MEYLMNNISFLFVFWYVIAAITMYLILYIIDHYVLPIIKQNKLDVQRWWNKLRTIIWGVFLCLFMYGAFQENMIITLAFGAMILGVGWFFWRNLFSGILIQFSEEFKVGDYISTDFATGELTHISLSQSELLNEKGELVIIPNHQLRNAVLKHIAKKSNVKTHLFSVVPFRDATIEDIRKLAIHCPYISSNQQVIVEPIAPGEYQIKAALIDSEYLEQARDWFR